MGGPLAGLTVIELANILAGPSIGQFCAELGARVIKVEPPGGDPTRGWLLDGESAPSGVSAYFSSTNRGKQSIVLDLADPDERHALHRLAAAADVVIVGYKPGDDVKLGVDAKTLRALNSGLIYLQITAYGSDDPRPGFDAIVQAEAGFTYLNGAADGPPEKMPVALVDLLAAHQLKAGLLLALMERTRTGRGSYVATSLLGSAVASLANQAGNYLHGGHVPERMGSEHPNIVPYGNRFTTLDGREMVLAVGTEPQFRALCQAVGLPALPADDRFSTNAARVRHRSELNGLLAAAFARLDAVAAEDALRGARVPFGFINDMAAVFAQPEARAQCFEDGTGVRAVALAGDITGASSLAPPPALNADRDAVLRWLDEAGPAG